MANTAHLVRRQSSRDLKPQKSVDKLEMKEMRGRLVVDNRKTNTTANYGATNAAFEDSSPNTKVIMSSNNNLKNIIKIIRHDRRINDKKNRTWKLNK